MCYNEKIVTPTKLQRHVIDMININIVWSDMQQILILGGLLVAVSERDLIIFLCVPLSLFLTTLSSILCNFWLFLYFLLFLLLLFEWSLLSMMLGLQAPTLLIANNWWWKQREVRLRIDIILIILLLSSTQIINQRRMIDLNVLNTQNTRLNM